MRGPALFEYCAEKEPAGDCARPGNLRGDGTGVPRDGAADGQRRSGVARLLGFLCGRNSLLIGNEAFYMRQEGIASAPAAWAANSAAACLSIQGSWRPRVRPPPSPRFAHRIAKSVTI